MSGQQNTPFLVKIEGTPSYAVGRITANNSLDTEIGSCNTRIIDKTTGRQMWKPTKDYYPYTSPAPNFCPVANIKLAPILRNIGWVPSNEFNPASSSNSNCPSVWGSIPAILFYVTFFMFVALVLIFFFKLHK